MAATVETPKGDVKPVIVRVKRKATQSRLDAFWLEINERPFKRPLIDFEKLSVSDSSSSKEELKTKKVFVQHVETVISSEVTADLVLSFVCDSTSSSIVKEKIEGRRHTFKADNHVQRQGQLLTKAKQKQVDLSKNARFEQIWKNRRGKDYMHDDALNEVCRLYNVVRVDTHENPHKFPEGDEELEDHRMMSQYLPLLRECMPSAAEEIESDMHDYISKRASSDGYVYDFYAIKDGVDTMEETTNHFPLVRVDDEDDFYDGPDDPEYETDDSNDENNPRNDYPEENSSGEEDESGTQSSNEDQSDAESESSSDESGDDISSHNGEGLDCRDLSGDGDLFLEDDMCSVDDGELYDYEDLDEEED
ncbi:unnamed protein product [Cuscuta epithymum]|uniref:Transcription factor Iwr1 domain-containing protein n=1 Tax=Cuscuta epithymum TaxID=186058 RepID=A0AAV0DU00_9ASTE|nr:unnamed protein product [Cuscuta epithymum]